MKMKNAIYGLVATACLTFNSAANATVITFDDIISGEISYAYDGDGDNIDDAVFTTTDPTGFNTIGPGTNQLYINEPGIEGTTYLSSDLRVDFTFGATGTLGFGFAMSTGDNDSGVTFSIFDFTDTLLASTTLDAVFTPGPSSFPEGLLSSSFAGTASYATFDFIGGASRYIIDNFVGTFGSAEVSRVSVPTTIALFGLGLASLGWSRRKTRS
jgi:hypothetical protein